VVIDSLSTPRRSRTLSPSRRQLVDCHCTVATITEKTRPGDAEADRADERLARQPAAEDRDDEDRQGELAQPVERLGPDRRPVQPAVAHVSSRVRASSPTRRPDVLGLAAQERRDLGRARRGVDAHGRQVERALQRAAAGVDVLHAADGHERAADGPRAVAQVDLLLAHLVAPPAPADLGDDGDGGDREDEHDEGRHGRRDPDLAPQVDEEQRHEQRDDGLAGERHAPVSLRLLRQPARRLRQAHGAWIGRVSALTKSSSCWVVQHSKAWQYSS
jgi:hypothetical protein